MGRGESSFPVPCITSNVLNKISGRPRQEDAQSKMVEAEFRNMVSRGLS